MKKCATFALFLCACLALAGPVGAHPLAPSLLELRETDPGHFEVRWKTPRQQPTGAFWRPVLPCNCRSTEPVESAVEGTGLIRRWTVDCGAEGLVGKRIGIQGLAGTSALARVELAGGRLLQKLLVAEDAEFVVPSAASWQSVAFDYLKLGFEHILGGLDHLLFVLGLLLLVGFRRQLVWTVTAFTLGHSVTLSLAALGWVHLPSEAIEVAIAASLLILAVELAREPNSNSLLRRRPWSMTALFGLLHGFGFAGALAEIGLPQSEIPLALASFNLGIEVGQLAFIVALYTAARTLLTLNLLERRPAWVTTLPVYFLGSLAAFWIYDRVALWWLNF